MLGQVVMVVEVFEFESEVESDVAFGEGAELVNMSEMEVGDKYGAVVAAETRSVAESGLVLSVLYYKLSSGDSVGRDSGNLFGDLFESRLEYFSGD